MCMCTMQARRVTCATKSTSATRMTSRVGVARETVSRPMSSLSHEHGWCDNMHNHMCNDMHNDICNNMHRAICDQVDENMCNGM